MSHSQVSEADRLRAQEMVGRGHIGRWAALVLEVALDLGTEAAEQLVQDAMSKGLPKFAACYPPQRALHGLRQLLRPSRHPSVMALLRVLDERAGDRKADVPWASIAFAVSCEHGRTGSVGAIRLAEVTVQPSHQPREDKLRLDIPGSDYHKCRNALRWITDEISTFEGRCGLSKALLGHLSLQVQGPPASEVDGVSFGGAVWVLLMSWRLALAELLASGRTGVPNVKSWLPSDEFFFSLGAETTGGLGVVGATDLKAKIDGLTADLCHAFALIVDADQDLREIDASVTRHRAEDLPEGWTPSSGGGSGAHLVRVNGTEGVITLMCKLNPRWRGFFARLQLGSSPVEATASAAPLLTPPTLPSGESLGKAPARAARAPTPPHPPPVPLARGSGSPPGRAEWLRRSVSIPTLLLMVGVAFAAGVEADFDPAPDQDAGAGDAPPRGCQEVVADRDPATDPTPDARLALVLDVKPQSSSNKEVSGRSEEVIAQAGTQDQVGTSASAPSQGASAVDKRKVSSKEPAQKPQPKSKPKPRSGGVPQLKTPDRPDGTPPSQFQCRPAAAAANSKNAQPDPPPPVAGAPGSNAQADC